MPKHKKKSGFKRKGHKQKRPSPRKAKMQIQTAAST